MVGKFFIYRVHFKDILYTFLLISFLSSCKKKNEVVIEGRYMGYKKGDYINYYLPINGFYNYQVFKTADIINDSGDFKIVAEIDSAGFIKIQGKTTVWLLVEAGDHIKFKEQSFTYPDSFAMKPVYFTGSNASMHYLYNKMNANLFYKFNYMSSLMEKAYPKGTDLYDTLLKGINAYLKPYDSLYEKKEISLYFLNIIKSDFRNVMWSFAITRNLSVLEQKNPWVSIGDAKEKLQRDVYKNSINTDPYLLHANWGASIVIYFMSDYENIFYPTDYPFYDDFFYKYGRVYKESAHLVPSFSEFNWGQILVGQKLQGEDHVEFSFDTIYSHFKEVYPNSAYIPIIENLLKRNNAEVNKRNKAINILDSTGNSISIRQILNNTQISNQYVFVDLWATWCGPCKQEFAYNDQLDSMLHNRNITKLYISEDPKPFTERWLNYIYTNNLIGYHVIAGDSLRKNISKFFYNTSEKEQYIPRYILINKEGKILDNNMPRPSDMPLLRNRIDELIK